MFESASVQDHQRRRIFSTWTSLPVYIKIYCLWWVDCDSVITRCRLLPCNALESKKRTKRARKKMCWKYRGLRKHFAQRKTIQSIIEASCLNSGWYTCGIWSIGLSRRIRSLLLFPPSFNALWGCQRSIHIHSRSFFQFQFHHRKRSNSFLCQRIFFLFLYFHFILLTLWAHLEC